MADVLRAEGPLVKRSKLDASTIIGHRGVTMSTVQAVLDALPGDFSSARSSFEKAGKEVYDGVKAVVKLDLIGGKHFDWYIASPQLLVQRLIVASACLQRAFVDACSSLYDPWHMVLYFDHITSGNITAPENARKFCAFYFTFKEFGHLRIRYQCFWFQIGILRRNIIKKVDGGLGAVVSALLKVMFHASDSFSAGIVICLASGKFLFYAILSNLLGDEAELTTVFDFKGSSGSKQCNVCVNCYKRGTFETDLPGFCTIACTDPKQLKLHSNESVWKSMDDLERLNGELTLAEFNLAQQSYGFNLNTSGLLAPSNRDIVFPSDQYTQDWPHVFLQHGVGNIEMWHMLKRLSVPIDELFEDVKSWIFPSGFRDVAKNAYQVFTPRRKESSRQEGYWKASISEFLVIAPVVLHYIQIHRARHEAEIKSFRLLCRVLDIIRSMKQGRMNKVEEFERKVLEHFRGVLALYGEDILIPKNHTAAMHLARQYARDGMVFDTMVNERTHQVPKGVGSTIKNLRAFEKSVVTRMVANQIDTASHFDETNGLRGTSAKLGKHIEIARYLFYNGFRVMQNDLILTDSDQTCVVLACGQRDSHLFVLADVCEDIRRLSCVALVRPQGTITHLWMEDNDFKELKCWRQLQNGDYEVIKPLA